MPPLRIRRVVGASDAVQESGEGSGGFFLIRDARFIRHSAIGAEVIIDTTVLALWQPQDVLIAQLELLMVLQVLLTFPDAFRNTHVIWWIDNLASLMALLKGRSENQDLDRMAQMIHLLLFHLHCFMWFEWAQSTAVQLQLD